MEDEEERWIKHYSSCHEILLVGEGDFSFALSLARAFGFALNMVATSLDSRDDLMRNYPGRAMENLRELEERGCMILHGVNVCSKMRHPYLVSRLFDRIVFNFPHSGYLPGFPEHTPLQILCHQEVVKGFFKSAREMLAEKGEVHVTHKTAYPFNKWEIESLAEEFGLCLVEKVCFRVSDFPGYKNKRGSGDKCNKTFPVGECSTFKFAVAAHLLLGPKI